MCWGGEYQRSGTRHSCATSSAAGGVVEVMSLVAMIWPRGGAHACLLSATAFVFNKLFFFLSSESTNVLKEVTRSGNSDSSLGWIYLTNVLAIIIIRDLKFLLHSLRLL